MVTPASVEAATETRNGARKHAKNRLYKVPKLKSLRISEAEVLIEIFIGNDLFHFGWLEKT